MVIELLLLILLLACLGACILFLVDYAAPSAMPSVHKVAGRLFEDIEPPDLTIRPNGKGEEK